MAAEALQQGKRNCENVFTLIVARLTAELVSDIEAVATLSLQNMFASGPD